MINKKTQSIALLVITTLMVGVTNAATVRFISPERTVEINGQSGVEILIRCAEIDAPRLIQRVSESDPWCAKDLPTMCAKQDIVAAKKVCGSFYERLVKKYNAQNPIKNESVADKNQTSTVEPTSTPPVKEELTSPTPETKPLAETEPLDSTTTIEQIDSAQIETPSTELDTELERIKAERARITDKRKQLEIQRKELESVLQEPKTSE